MRETFTSGSVGRAPGNWCLYPEMQEGDRYPESSLWETEAGQTWLIRR
jgi:hypothetical protein